MKKLLVSLMLIISSAVNAQSVTSLDPSQVYDTANIVNNTTAPTNTTGTWQNIGLWNQGLPCWGPGGPVYCGPQPYFNNGSFNFSYGMTDVYQTANVANSLPGLGAGLRVNGYNFGFMAKNGNGWDGGRPDYLVAYTIFRDASGAEKYSKTYDLNKNFGYWVNYNFSETFTTPFATKDLGTVQYGFVGMDNNYWAGPYGPEVTNISFSLKYSVDPCYANVLSSPTCPGYLDALNKLLPPTTVESTPVTTTSTSAVSTTTVTVEPTAVTTSTTTTVGQPTVVAPVVSAPAPATSSTTSATTATTTSTQSNKENASNNNSLALSIISKNQERDSAALSVSQNAVSQAAQAALQSQQEAATVAASAVANSQTANVVAVGGPQNPGTGIRVNAAAAGSTQTLSNMISAVGAVTLSTLNPPAAASMLTVSTSSVTQEQPQQPQITVPTNNAPVTSVQNYAIVPPNFLTDKTNPLTEIVEGRVVVPDTSTNTFAGPAVNQKAGDNDAAGGVSISKMALAPVGYGDYLNFTLRDAAFYAPREVYRNQRTVDNAQVLRQLTNDSRHRDMVEQQYRR